MKKVLLSSLVAVLVCVFLVACANPKRTAEEAINAAGTALAAAKDEAVKIIPDQVKALEDKLAAAKDAVAKSDYQGALTAANDVAAKVKDLAAAAAAKKPELTKKWEEMSASLPAAVEAIKVKTAALAKAKKLPADMDKDKVAAYQTMIEDLGKVWADAEAAFKKGMLGDAVAKAATVNEKAEVMMKDLGMKK